MEDHTHPLEPDKAREQRPQTLSKKQKCDEAKQNHVMWRQRQRPILAFLLPGENLEWDTKVFRMVHNHRMVNGKWTELI